MTMKANHAAHIQNRIFADIIQEQCGTFLQVSRGGRVADPVLPADDESRNTDTLSNHQYAGKLQAPAPFQPLVPFRPLDNVHILEDLAPSRLVHTITGSQIEAGGMPLRGRHRQPCVPLRANATKPNPLQAARIRKPVTSGDVTDGGGKQKVSDQHKRPNGLLEWYDWRLYYLLA